VVVGPIGDNCATIWQAAGGGSFARGKAGRCKREYMLWRMSGRVAMVYLGRRGGRRAHRDAGLVGENSVTLSARARAWKGSRRSRKALLPCVSYCMVTCTLLGVVGRVRAGLPCGA
jgi:hypothetical protein